MTTPPSCALFPNMYLFKVAMSFLQNDNFKTEKTLQPDVDIQHHLTALYDTNATNKVPLNNAAEL